MADTFMTVRSGPGGEWFVPTDHSRGPWDPDACHAGPPTALIVRALERTVPGMRLARVSLDLGRPVPMAGFSIVTEIVRAGRATANSRAAIVDGDGETRATATGLHVSAGAADLFDRTLDNSAVVTPRLADAVPGPFPIGRNGHRHGLASFRDAVEVCYPTGENSDPGATTVWMRTVPLLPDEAPSPFQRIAPLADCGNAFSRHAEPDEIGFVNVDLVIAIHRDPVGEWLGSRVVSHWQPSGVGLADAVLFDDQGAVGRALQTLLLRPAQ